jgi:lysine-N-methylase
MLTAVTPTVLAAARYMTRFRCLGGDCEATCCAGWGIAVEPSAHRRLKLLAEGDAALGQLLDDGIQLTPEGPDYARLKFLPSGECSMLDSAGLCSIHARFGHDALFDVCATYPRYVNSVDNELELFGTFSCPELARLGLLAGDAFELTPLEVMEPPRKLRNRFNTDRPYYRLFKLVRDATLGLLSCAGYALREKLFVLLWLSDKLRPVLHSGCAPVPDAMLKGAFDALSDAQVLDALTSNFRGLALDGPLPLMILHAALRPGAEASSLQTAHFDAMVRKAWDVYGLASAPAGESSEVELLAVWSKYGELRAGLASSAAERIETCLARYAMNHVLTTPYMLSDSLFEYSYDLVVRVACLRFLLVTKIAADSDAEAELDPIIVSVVFAFARGAEHSDLPRRLQTMLARQGLDGLAHAACFLAV